MKTDEQRALDRIAELYLTISPEIAKARLAEALLNSKTNGARGPHGPLGYYACGTPGAPATPAEMYANHLENCLYCLASPYDFVELLPRQGILSGHHASINTVEVPEWSKGDDSKTTCKPADRGV